MPSVLITGANRGIGLELTRLFAQNSWRVFACCRTPEKASDLGQLAQDFGERVSVHSLEVTDDLSIDSLALSLKDEPLDLLVNNAGIMGGEKQGIQEMDFAAWEETFRVNTIAPFRVFQAFLPNLKLSPAPKVATISSQMGALNRESAGAYAYRSSKAAVNKVMQTLACEMAMENFIITLFHPGWVKTDMGGAHADITTEESAAGLYQKMSRLEPRDNGKFYKWNGEEHPW